MEKRRKHTCCVCKTTDEWNDNWSWYGSYMQIDNGKRVMKFCSEKCAQEKAKTSTGLASAMEHNQ